MISTGSSDAGNSHTNLIHNKSRATEFSPGRFNFQTLSPVLQTSKEQVFTHPNLKENIGQVKRRKHCFSHNVHQKRMFRHLIMSDNNSNDCHSAPLLALPWLTIRPLTDCQTVYIRYTHICLLSYKLKQPAS